VSANFIKTETCIEGIVAPFDIPLKAPLLVWNGVLQVKRMILLGDHKQA
jgi:hypothetical protein